MDGYYLKQALPGEGREALTHKGHDETSVGEQNRSDTCGR